MKLDDTEVLAIKQLVELAGLEVDVEALRKKFRIAKEISFANDPKGESSGSLGLEFNVRMPGALSFEPLCAAG
ncbi:hypothetical protein [Pseudomonas sp. Teo4]|uniref:hypothetical protein n=1 Tax=Pseudomonas sp. Teo4 TaxID=3064528 RepID=UPI002ACB0B5D|nr:hypothetical protein [Pseudomonas sp. Teo4]